MTWYIPSDLPCTSDVQETGPDVASCWVLVPAAGKIVALDTVSALIWRAADGAADARIVAMRLEQDHGWDATEIEEDVRNFVASLLDHGLLKVKTR